MTNLMQEIDKPVQPLVVPQPREVQSTALPPSEVGFATPAPRWPRYVEALFIRKFLILGALLASLLLAWVAMIVWPKQYESEAKLMIRVGRESVALDPTATTSQTIMLQKTQEEEVNSALDLLRSRRIAERTVEKLGAENINAGVLPSNQPAQLDPLDRLLQPVTDFVGKTLLPLLYAVGIKEELTERELAIMELTKHLVVTAERRSAVISIEAFSKTPAMAQAIAQTVGEEFINEYLEVTHNAGSYAFFSGQAQEANETRSALADLKHRFMLDRKLVTIAANQNILVDQLGTIEREIITARAELDKALAEIGDVDEKLSHMPDEVVSEKKQSGDATWSGMRQQVYTLELEEKTLASKYPDDYPLLTQVREKLVGARAILEKLESERIDESKTPNPLRLRLEEEYQRLQTKVVGLRANLQLREAQHDEVEHKIAEILDSERDLEQIERDIKMADTRLDLLRQKNEEARVLSEMQADRISNLSMFQPATLVERPASPNKKLLVLAFAVLGLTASSALALLQEFNSKRLRTVADVERGLGLPVIGSIRKVRNTTVRTQHLLKLVRQRPKLQAEFRAIISDIMLTPNPSTSDGARGRTLGVIGISPGVGSSTISAAMAIVATEKCGLVSTLIDANCGNSSLSKFFNLNGTPGLAELANGDATHEECVQKRSESGLSLISSSSAYKERLRFDAPPKSLGAAIDNFQQSSDLVIVDLPPAVSADRTVALTHYMDFVLLVVESEKTELAVAERIVRRLAKSDRQVVGVILNKTQRYLPNWLSNLIGLH